MVRPDASGSDPFRRGLRAAVRWLGCPSDRATVRWHPLQAGRAYGARPVLRRRATRGRPCVPDSRSLSRRLLLLSLLPGAVVRGRTGRAARPRPREGPRLLDARADARRHSRATSRSTRPRLPAEGQARCGGGGRRRVTRRLVDRRAGRHASRARRAGPVQPGRRRLHLLRVPWRRTADRLLARPDRRPLRRRRGHRRIRDQLDVHPGVRHGPHVHLREHDVRLLDRDGARRPRGVRQRRRASTPGHPARLGLRGRRRRRQGAGSNRQLDATVGGSFALDATAGVGSTLTALGYPAAGKYHGSDLVVLPGHGRHGPRARATRPTGWPAT